MFVETSLVIILASIFLVYTWSRNMSKSKLPPGPLAFSLIGNLIQLGSKPHLKFSQWADKYGKLYTISMGNKRTLVVSDAKLMKELFGMMATTGRMKTEMYLSITRGSYGILNSEGDVYLEQKQFCMKALKQFGFGRGSTLEPLIMQEANMLCEWIDLEQKSKKNILINRVLTQSSINTLWNVIVGERIETGESEIVRILNDWMKYLQRATETGLMFFPWIKYIAPVKSGYYGFQKVLNEMQNYVESSFAEHRKKRNPENLPKDLIDALIDKVETCHNKSSSFYGETGWKHSYATVKALLIAGGDSVGMMITWAIFYLCAYPDAQKKMQDEIDSVIGRNREPSLKDKPKMPFLEAVILESLRVVTMGPFGIIHELLEDITFQGYQLPKGLLLLGNLYHVHRDKNVWGDPEIFRPERFLNEGARLKEFLVVFQPGKRMCPADQFVKDVMFLFVARIFQKFSIEPMKNIENVEDYLEPVTGYALFPKELPVLIKSRN